jgi:hypothetical protein
MSIGVAAARDLPANWIESLPDSDVSHSGAESPPVTEPQREAVDSSLNASSIGTARAQYLSPPTAVERPISVQPQYLAVSGGFDSDSVSSRTAYADAYFSPFGIYQSGARVRLTGIATWYRYLASDNPRTIGTGHLLEGGLLIGYGVWLPGFNINWYIGPAFGEGVNQGVTTDRWGAKAVIDINGNPTNLTMASGSVSYSTIGNNLQVQTKAGLKIFGDVYFGPEAKFSWQRLLPFQVNFSTPAVATTTPVSSQTNIETVRVGAHLSTFTIGPAFIALAGGWVHDRQLGSGYYGNVTLYQHF